ncbi:hypothetical protein CERSUDRAFT_126148 [Gelatoporia subvermispora B]|uniref:Uncharacterized protein n=1 Tax=Ceriporiopsis subvermispora (strain B) TaxID=914234 RepID=M2PCJ5_CERS8|nr:hypothetical protein CERSUDRAFT_126148 [Gelatoporia subvermispora B]
MLAGEAVQVARLNAERRQEMVKEQARLNCAEAKARLEDPTTDKVPGTPTPTRFNKGNIAAIRERYLGYKDLKMLEEQINERRRVSLLRPIPVPSTKLIEPAATISKPPKDVIPKADVGCTEVVPAPSTIDIPTPIVETVSTPPEEPVPETPKAVSLTLSTADSRDDASDTSLDSPWTKAPLPTSRPGDHAPPLRMPTFLTPEVPQPVDKPLPKALSQAFGLPKRDQQLIIRIPSRQERLAAAATLIAERAKVAVQVHSVIDVQEFDPKAAAKSPARSPKTRTPAVRLPRPVKARNIPGAAPSRIPVLRRATRARKVPETPLYRPVQERDTENLMRNVLINCARRVSPVPQKPKTPVTELRLTDTITTPRPQVPTAAFARPVGPRLSKHQEKTPIVPRPKRTDVPARPQVPNAAFARATQVFPAPPSAEKAREIRCKTVDIPARRPLPSAAFALPIRVAKPPVKKDSHSKIIRPAAARPQLQSARPTSVRGAKSPDSPYPARLVKRADENSPPATKCSSTAKGDVRRPALRPLRILEGITIPGGAKLSGCTA